MSEKDAADAGGEEVAPLSSKVKPLRNLGGCSLMFGISVVGAINMCICIVLVATIPEYDSSTTVFAITVTPSMRLIQAAWALAGIPVIIAGVWGAAYAISSHVEVYLWYLVIGLVVQIATSVYAMVFGNLCSGMPIEFVNQAQNVVCGGASLLVILWLFLIIAIWGGAAFVVWSCVQVIQEAEKESVLARRLLLDPQKRQLLAQRMGSFVPENRGRADVNGFNYMASERDAAAVEKLQRDIQRSTSTLGSQQVPPQRVDEYQRLVAASAKVPPQAPPGASTSFRAAGNSGYPRV
uniref:Uncharacterized protein n=1 Tax=Chromera velia CCMP2878 TaxID=1169474 RepID=A0A0G4FW73_9ALVE|eukprot:Cvel_3821.t1-p1 / transcript=Cvel_3821.t1 / gene=Cvel_3821 / organism=Chromera_velia_CCMP2878 / gene_product=hypothetical protein / transcript_product=hypothetical protein / location=Cvel_scaffold161:51911-52789(+) / protein_length=293 / sequence_SO=supercontig / SO=protein_coding / is_pseudo=false